MREVLEIKARLEGAGLWHLVLKASKAHGVQPYHLISRTMSIEARAARKDFYRSLIETTTLSFKELGRLTARKGSVFAKLALPDERPGHGGRRGVSPVGEFLRTAPS